MLSSLWKTLKLISTIFRFVELASSSIVTGILGRYLHFVSQAGDHKSGRVIYTIVIGAISIFFSLLLILPLKYTFYAFPFDFAMFVCWLIAFALLVNRSGGCDSSWYRRDWGYYWGRWYRRIPGASGASGENIGTSACGKWRTTTAFSFISSMFWLFSFALGLYALYRKRSDDRRPATTTVPRHQPYATNSVDHNKEQGYMASGVEPTQAHREQVNRQEIPVQTEHHYTTDQSAQQYRTEQPEQHYRTVQTDQQYNTTCPHCQAVSGPGSRFCNSCGSPQAVSQTVRETV